MLSLSGMLRVTLSGRGVPLAARFTPLVLDSPGVPRHDETGESTKLVNELSLADFGAAAATIGPGGRIPFGAAAASSANVR